MTHPDWTGPLIDFLSRNLPPAEEGWIHMSLSAYEFGCDALAALGQADETGWGAVPRPVPRLPDVLPRWDDLCVVAVKLANQQNRLEFRRADGSRLPERLIPVRVRIVGDRPLAADHLPQARDRPQEPPPPAPSIAASAGLGLARATDEAMALLDALGLTAGGRWTTAAETVLWRVGPEEWDLDPTCTPRFAAAVEKAGTTLPPDLEAEIARLTKIVARDLVDAVARDEAWRTTLPRNVTPGPSLTLDIARPDLVRNRGNQIDGLFYRRWRLDDGWLSPAQATRALAISRDSLADDLRKAVVARLHPEFDPSAW